MTVSESRRELKGGAGLHNVGTDSRIDKVTPGFFEVLCIHKSKYADED